jgi:hypothetical protein
VRGVGSDVGLAKRVGKTWEMGAKGAQGGLRLLWATAPAMHF